MPESVAQTFFPKLYAKLRKKTAGCHVEPIDNAGNKQSLVDAHQQ